MLVFAVCFLLQLGFTVHKVKSGERVLSRKKVLRGTSKR